jgi:hypothetical protein
VSAIVPVLPTPWDSKIIGVPTAEIRVHDHVGLDSLSAVISLAKAKFGFITVKSDFWSHELSTTLSSHALLFAEQQFSFQRSSSDPRLLAAPVETEAVGAGSDELNRIYRAIHAGLFDTDRYSMHSNFGLTVSASRYISWIQDTLDNGGKVLQVWAKGSLVGFFVLDLQKPDCPLVTLSAVFKDHKIPGSGILLHGAISQTLQINGGSVIESRVSSNNLAALVLHTSLGYRITETQFVFTEISPRLA